MSQHRTGRRNYSVAGDHAFQFTPFTFARYSVACERHPNRNEDSLLADERTGLAAVFDGVGGSAAGEIASQTAARSAHHGWKEALLHLQKGRKVHGLLEDYEKACTIIE